MFKNAKELKRWLASHGCVFENHNGGSGHLTVGLGDFDDALMRAVDALEEALAARMSQREPLPLPTVALSAQTMLKLALYRAMQEGGVSKAELARRLSAHGPQVDRLLDLQHNSRVDSLESALHLLGKRVLVNTASL